MAQNPAAALKRQQNALLVQVNRTGDRLSAALNLERRRIDSLRRRKTIVIAADINLMQSQHNATVANFKEFEAKIAAFVDWVRA